ncbi:MAG: class I SAM-dependent methyltransferase [Pirellulales bacterium]
MIKYVDDPARDFREQYDLPYHFIWERHFRHHLACVDYTGYVRAALDLLPPPPAEVLDVGCGDGCLARKATDRGYCVVGVDYSERAVGFARLMVPEGEFHVEDIRDLGQRKQFRERFGAAYCVEVLEHLPPEYQLHSLRQIHECLKKSGCLVLTVPSVYMPVTDLHYKHFRLEEIVELLRQAGFEVRAHVNQGTVTFLKSRRFWRFVYNRYYDLRRVRVALAEMLLRKYNVTDNPERARRYIVQAVKV